MIAQVNELQKKFEMESTALKKREKELAGVIEENDIIKDKLKVTEEEAASLKVSE